ncbi:MAG: hypothetical protein DRP56_00870 [Planctomycetota bacterium]|nr:MAG: hypothetical protein DRP56_00870 [Planctomycetota bacterium]
MKVYMSLLIAVFFMIQGCTATHNQYAVSASMLAVEASVLKNQYKKVETAIRTAQDQKKMFSESEWRTLLNVDATLDMLVLKYEALTKLQYAEVSLPDVTFMYRLAVNGYTQGREVVMAHWDEFQPSSQIMLNAFDTQAQETSGRVTELLENPDNENINEALTLISGILSLGVKMLGVAAVM